MPRYPLRLLPLHARETIERHLTAAGVDPAGAAIIAQKTGTLVVRIDMVGAPAANILKQQLLSLGGDAAVHREAIAGRPDSSPVYLVADERRLAALPEKLAYQPFGLPQLGSQIDRLLAALRRPPLSIPLARGSLDLRRGPLVMGVLNVTPDSFSDGGLYLDPDRARDRALQMAEEGASIIDIGGESTRPGSRSVDPGEERRRVIAVLERIAPALRVPVSIDTRNADVARAAIDAGAALINDVSGVRHDPRMVDTVRESGAAVVVMHMLGTPETMQRDPRYGDPVAEIIEWLGARTDELASAGVPREKIIVDPGIGFGKRLRDNLALIEEIAAFHGLGFPVLVGYSRKSFIGAITGREPSERIWGGLAALGKCLEGGVQIVRVHEVRETVDFLKVWRALEEEEGPA